MGSRRGSAASRDGGGSGAPGVIYVDPDEWRTLMEAIDRGMSRTQEAHRDASYGDDYWVPFIQRILSDDKSMRRWTGFDRRGLALVWASFSERWEGAERAEIARRRESKMARAGKRGPRPAADVAADRQNNIPLVRDDPARGAAPGNRCRLETFHIMILALMRKYGNENEGKLGDMFGVDQSTVSGYLVPADRILAEMLPAPGKIMDLARDVGTPEEFIGLFPDGTGEAVVIFDGTHVRFARPLGAERRDPMISCKKKYPGGNTVIMVSGDGLILGASRTYNGRVHDIAITRDFLGDMGRFGEMLRGRLESPDAGAPDAEGDAAPSAAAEAAGAPAGQKRPGTTDPTQEEPPEQAAREVEIRTVRGLAALGSADKKEQKLSALDASRRLEAMHDLERLLGDPPAGKARVMGDSGFQGLGQDMQAAEVFVPFKNSKNLRITPEQKGYSHELSRRRIKVENAICSAKHFRRVSEIYNGSLDRFNAEFNIACGLANLRHMLRNGTYGHWAGRLGLRPPGAGR